MSSRAIRREKNRLKMTQSNQVEKPKGDKSTTSGHWYKKPVGLIVIGVTTTLIAATIIGIFEHFVSPMKEKVQTNTLLTIPAPKLVTQQQVTKPTKPVTKSLNSKQITMPPTPPVITMEGNTANHIGAFYTYKGPTPPSISLKNNHITNAKEIVSISTFSNMTQSSRETKTKERSP